MPIRDRIRELRRIPAGELLPHPRNWRKHPRKQEEAVRGALAEIGYADALLARETAEGHLMLIDGHLRAGITPDSIVPVLILDVTEDESDKLLATLDPLAALARPDADRLAQLLETVATENAALGELLADLGGKAAPAAPESGPEPLTHQYNVLVTCESESQQVELLARLTDEGFQCRAFIV
jgi:hypothetical protein